MSTSRHFDKICAVILCLALIITVFFMNGEAFGLVSAERTFWYVSKLFDTSKVHTIDIVMDDLDSFIENCIDEEYRMCTVVIDNESKRNVGIRAKGNTSLTQVKAYGNNRYSFKIEFDHYDSTSNYYGLDKLCLNNIIQDNTYMKDYIVYDMMNFLGVVSPLSSYVYITVNGKDWGLYLAVEGVEESFLQRNYGSDYGNLYKPDSTSFGGGRGNGEKFDIDKFDGDIFNNQEVPDKPEKPSENTDGGQDGFSPGESIPNQNAFNPGEFAPNQNKNRNPGNFGNRLFGDEQNRDFENPPFDDFNGQDKDFSNTPSDMPKGEAGQNHNEDGKNLGTKTESDVSLIYTDDSYESYSNIFDNAKTNVSNADKDRLISSLKQLNSNENMESIVDIEAVMKYFAVHNFVLNFDSYTGSMVHNYYLYEKDGKLSMLPWDYNLSFGGFQSMSDATSLINYPIDTPVSGGNVSSRPMLSWIFSSETYTELYHKYLSQFISEYFDSGKFTETVSSVKTMISPYVEKDPTKFCTYDEFLTGIDILKDFCLLRAESVSCQLTGEIPSTSDGQNENDENFVDASVVSVAAMGSMNGDKFGKNENRFFEKNDMESSSLPFDNDKFGNNEDFRSDGKPPGS